MIRTQVYLDDQLHRDLMLLARLENKPMAEVTREILRTGVTRKKAIDTSGKGAMLAIAKMGLKGGDDPYLSANIDHYLYGAPKKQP